VINVSDCCGYDLRRVGLAVGKYAARFLNRLASLEPDNSVLPGRRMRTRSGLLYTAFIALCRL